jgi:hypothetical protein
LPGVGHIDGDPLFVGSPTNYGLQATSPCVNAGIDQMAWMIGALDLCGHPRILGGHVDIGAYEYVPPTGTCIMIH